jgi:arylsulfatase A-like enzyme
MLKVFGRKILSHMSQDTDCQIAAYDERSVLSTRPAQLGGLLLLAVWFGLVTGLAEVSIRAVQKFFLGQIIHLSPHVVWMAPLADLILFAITGVILYLGARCWPRLGSLYVSTFIFSFLGFLGPLLWAPRLHLYAALLLTTGLAVQTARFIASHSHGFLIVVRRTTGWMAGLVIALAVNVHVGQVLTERNAHAKSTPLSSDTPNVLLIVLDTVRAKSLSLYGYPRVTTPQLERFAKKGVLFERALSTSPWTLPSHASMFTGHFPHELSADWKTPLDSTYLTLAEVFRLHGYITAGFVANFIYSTYEWGLNRGFVHYEDYPISLGMIASSSWLARTLTIRFRRTIGNHHELVFKTAEKLNEDFLRWLSRKDHKPFFAFLNYMDAHAPYLPPKPFDSKFGPKRTLAHSSLREKWSPKEIPPLVDAYDGEIAYLDHHLGQLFDELQKQDLLENTLVIITSDHGEHFGEHGLMDHGNSLYRPLLHIPLLLSFPPGVPAGVRVREPVTLRDLAATVVDLVGINGEARFPGISLMRYWKSEGTNSSLVGSPLLSEVSSGINMPAWFPVAKGDMKSLVVGRYQYIKNGDGREEVYNFENDLAERNDLAQSNENQPTLRRLRAALKTSIVRNRQSN